MKRPYRQYLGCQCIFPFGLIVVPFRHNEETDTYDVVVTTAVGAHMVGDVREYHGCQLDTCFVLETTNSYPDRKLDVKS